MFATLAAWHKGKVLDLWKSLLGHHAFGSTVDDSTNGYPAMANYDFISLNDKEFEILCADILSVNENNRFERFKAGRDGGVDGRFFALDGSEVILQCKHWQASPIERLIKYLSDVELPKIKKLNPTRYLLAVSHALSRSDKNRISKILSPFVNCPTDIFGREDLNDLLTKNPEIERRQYKLWIQNTAVLQYLLEKPIYDRSAATLEDIRADSRLYVPTENHPASLKKLETLGTAIITGAPGIGKTTLANHLILDYLEKGFKLLRISDGIREAESSFEAEKKQIFYFDDFLGRNYLEALTGHEGSNIVQFIKRISRDRTKRFILTSRTTILNQGKSLIDVFSQNNLDRNEFEITIESLSEIDKAHILYNHLWHSDLPRDYIEELYAEKRYRQVISHGNFNPRLIRFITDASALDNCAAKDYWARTQSLLVNPAKVWEHPFEAQLDDFGRALVLLVALNGRPVPHSDLAEAFSRMVARAESSGYTGHRDFLFTLRHLVGSLLKRTATNSKIFTSIELDLFNPSVGDFVLHRYAIDTPTLRAAFCSLRSETSIKTLVSLVSAGTLQRRSAVQILDSVLLNAVSLQFSGYMPEYIALASMAFVEHEIANSPTSLALKNCIEFVTSSDCPLNFFESARFIRWSLAGNFVTPGTAEVFAEQAYLQSPHSDELLMLSEIQQQLDRESRYRLKDQHDEATVSYLKSSIYSEFNFTEVFDGIEPEDVQGAREKLRSLVEARLSELGSTASSSDINAVVDYYDVEAEAERYFVDAEPDEEWRENRPLKVAIDEIDDLFDRT